VGPNILLRISGEVILLIKYSSVKRNAEFNKTKKEGNNEFPN
jgi:hypothetical protein